MGKIFARLSVRSLRYDFAYGGKFYFPTVSNDPKLERIPCFCFMLTAKEFQTNQYKWNQFRRLVVPDTVETLHCSSHVKPRNNLSAIFAVVNVFLSKSFRNHGFEGTFFFWFWEIFFFHILNDRTTPRWHCSNKSCAPLVEQKKTKTESIWQVAQKRLYNDVRNHNGVSHCLQYNVKA